MLKIVDKYLDNLIRLELNSKPILIETEMCIENNVIESDWNKWIPIPSTVQDSELDELEIKLKYRLPTSYRIFLKHKHFYELYIHECGFCQHAIHTWKESLTNMIFKGWPTEYLIDNGIVPFADWSDWGHLCLDTNSECENNDFQIVLWDHDRPLQFEYQYENFEIMMKELDILHQESWE